MFVLCGQHRIRILEKKESNVHKIDYLSTPALMGRICEVTNISMLSTNPTKRYIKWYLLIKVSTHTSTKLLVTAFQV